LLLNFRIGPALLEDKDNFAQGQYELLINDVKYAMLKPHEKRSFDKN